MWKWTHEAKIDNIPIITEHLDEVLEKLECKMKAKIQLDVAVDELYSNIAHYAYAGGSGVATVQVDYNEAERMLSVSFIDQGKPYNPLEKEDPDLNVSIEERGIGGLGIFLVKKTMDGMDYRYENGQNILTIHKRI